MIANGHPQREGATRSQLSVAQHEQETAAALLASVEDHVKAGLAVESDRMAAEVNVAARKGELVAAYRTELPASGVLAILCQASSSGCLAVNVTVSQRAGVVQWQNVSFPS